MQIFFTRSFQLLHAIKPIAKNKQTKSLSNNKMRTEAGFSNSKIIFISTENIFGRWFTI